MNYHEKKRTDYKRRFQKECKTCKKGFLGVHNQLYCSLECDRHYQEKVPLYPGLSPSSTGALGELRVSIDLMRRGYEVFRALSPSSPCDLIAMKDGKVLRIEVRTARRDGKGNPYFPRKIRDQGRQDHFALALQDEIVYTPELLRTDNEPLFVRTI